MVYLEPSRTVVVLDRPRHERLAEEIRATGAPLGAYFTPSRSLMPHHRAGRRSGALHAGPVAPFGITRPRRRWRASAGGQPRDRSRTGQRQCTARRNDPSIQEEPWLDFSSGYVQRTIGKFPKQGSKAPWKLHQNYARDLMALKFGAVTDEVMVFSNPAPKAAAKKAA